MGGHLVWGRLAQPKEVWKVVRTASFRKFNLDNGPSPWEILTFKGPRISAPHFEMCDLKSRKLAVVPSSPKAAGLRTAALEFVTSRIERIAVAMDLGSESSRRL